jgi:hypothetical protein
MVTVRDKRLIWLQERGVDIMYEDTGLQEPGFGTPPELEGRASKQAIFQITWYIFERCEPTSHSTFLTLPLR